MIKLLRIRTEKQSKKRTTDEQAIDVYIIVTREINKLRISLNSVKNERLLKIEDDEDVEEEDQKIDKIKVRMLQTKRDVEWKRVNAMEVCDNSASMLLKMINFYNSKKRKPSKTRTTNEQRDIFMLWLEWNVPCFFDRVVAKDYELVDVAGILAPDRVAHLTSSATNVLLKCITLKSLNTVQHDLELTLALRHDILMPIEAVFVEDAVMYMQYPFVDSGDLLHWLKRFDMNSPLLDTLYDIDLVQKPTMRSQQDIRHVFKQINMVIGYLHDRNLVLRQLKPQCIYVTDVGKVHMIHYGLWSESTAIDRYTPPEVLSGGTYTQQSDIFTLGVMLYEALIGELEFDDDENVFVPDDAQVMNQMISSSALEVLRQMLQSSPSLRPTSRHLTDYEYFSSGFAKDERLISSNEAVADIRKSLSSYKKKEVKGSPQLFSKGINSNDELVPVVLEFFKENVTKYSDLVKDLYVERQVTKDTLSGAELFRIFFELLLDSDLLQEVGAYFIPVDDEEDSENKTLTFMSLGKILGKCFMEGYSIQLMFPLWMYRFLIIDSPIVVDFYDPKQGDEELTNMVQRTMPFLATISKASLMLQDTETLLRLFGLDINDDFTVPQLVRHHVDNQLFGEYRQRLQYLNAIKRGFWKVVPKDLIDSKLNENPRVNTTEILSLLLSYSSHLDGHILADVFVCDTPDIKAALFRAFEEMPPTDLKRFAMWTFGMVYHSQTTNHNTNVEVCLTSRTMSHAGTGLVELQADSTKLQGVFKAHLISTVAAQSASTAPLPPIEKKLKIDLAASRNQSEPTYAPPKAIGKEFLPEPNRGFQRHETFDNAPLRKPNVFEYFVNESKPLPPTVGSKNPTAVLQKYCPACDMQVLDLDDHVKSKIHQQNVSGVKIETPTPHVTAETPYHAKILSSTREATYHAPKQTFEYDPNVHSNANLYYCHICNMQLNGPEPYQLHLNGRKHKLTVERNNMSKDVTGDTSRPFFCELCEIQCTGPESYLAHLDGKAHKRMQNRKEILKQINKSMDAPKVLEKQSFGGVKTSAEALFHCDLCNVDCSGSMAYQQHVMGGLHKKNEEKRRVEERIMARQQPIPQTNTGSLFSTDWFGPTRDMFSSTSLFSNHGFGAPQTPYPAKYNEPIQRPLEPEPQTHDLFHCPVCDIYLNSVESFVAHNEGKKHHKEIAKQNATILQQANLNQQNPVSLLPPTSESVFHSNFDEERAIQILEYFFKNVLRTSVTYDISSSGPVHMTKYMVEVEIPSLPPTISNNRVAPHSARTIIGEGSSKALAKKDAAVKACQLLGHWGILQQTIPRNLLYKPT